MSAPSIDALRDLVRRGKYPEALEGAQAALEAQGEAREVLFIAAHALRHLRRTDEALAMLERLEAVAPRYSRLFEERGLCHTARRDAPAAIEALLTAVNLNPALPMAWRTLEGLYRITGDAQNAATAAAHVASLAALPAEVVAATALFSDGEAEAAEAIVRAFLVRQGDHPEAMRLLAKIGMAHEVLDDAELLLTGALALAPDYRAARYDLADCLVRRQKPGEALREIGALRAFDPDNLDYMAIEAAARVGLGDHEAAIGLYQTILAREPGASEVHLWLGHALKTVGRVEAAIGAYREAARLRPGFGEAWWSLANLKTYRFTDAEMAAMAAAEAAPGVAQADREHLCFALGKAHEDAGEDEAAWSFYARGNGLRRAASRYRPQVIETNTARQKAVCTRGFFAARRGWGDPAPDPIFVVGLPRSGSTLIEQILASHSKVEGTTELANIQRMVIGFNGRDPDLANPLYPGVLEGLSAAQVAALGERYLEETAVYRTGAPLFIDKNPNNFRHIGLIHLMLPNAKIIDARREPMACCFGNLKQLFAQGQEFAYSIEDIARYYRTYLELMAHWDEALPGRVLRVHHEDVVDDLEGQVRRLLDHCGLPFEAGCVQFHKSARSVRTPSAEQVRRPIFREGLDQWRRYEAWLEPLRAALGDAVERYRG